MMLTVRDRRALNEIARQPAGADPQFAAPFTRMAPEPRQQGPAIVLSVTLVAWWRVP